MVDFSTSPLQEKQVMIYSPFSSGNQLPIFEHLDNRQLSAKVFPNYFQQLHEDADYLQKVQVSGNWDKDNQLDTVR